jgi:putative acetyltransferase
VLKEHRPGPQGEESVSEDLEIRVESPGRGDVRALLLAVSAWSADLYPPESRHGLDASDYERPEITLFVARQKGVAVGCGAYQLRDDGSAEVKSMFVTAEARGRGIGRAVLAAIEDALRGRVASLRLETGVKQLAAIQLYESAGFVRRGPFGSYRADPLSVFMEKPLADRNADHRPPA